MRTPINSQSAAYRHGLVLGLTMAELMLLLVFCLLAASGALLARQQNATQRAERHNADLRRALVQNQAVLQAIRSDETLSRLVHPPGAAGKPARAIDDSWTRLVAADKTLETAEQQGLTREAIREGASYLAEADTLRRKGVDVATLRRDVAVGRALDQAIGTDEIRQLAPEAVADIVRQGVARTAQDDQPRPPGGHHWPPIIRLSEADGYYFPVGSAEVDPRLAGRLRTAVTDRLVDTLRTFDADVIEVIGHTDDLPVAQRVSNLDRALADVVRGGMPVADLVPADNAGLGLARAVAVAKVLMQEPRLAGYRILPLSAAQMTGTDERLSTPGGGDIKERRRIEIRVRRSSG